ncbi:MAG: SusC/RagA family TonB-linked outer membrane protein [Prevotellaceae bacterium]|jgi:TonB-linked SusC/RagA family outer membrane protein|nr:SusC/RagA family TonB-linked outer membrane protein [Prevotellaceae bacterium]
MARIALLAVLFFTLAAPAMSAPQAISGTVKDADSKMPVVGVAVRVQGSTRGTFTDRNGQFFIQAEEKNVIEFSMMGYKAYTHTVQKNSPAVNVLLEEDAVSLEDVVVESGIIQRNKLGFTGAYSTVSSEELKSVGNINLLQSLKSLDPGVAVMDNNLSGSNPNAMANIEVRGQTSMSITTLQDEASATSNQPLFILDGFEATLQEINDLDVNRVESITILKDAGSTAIFGAKGANGVIVVETVKPKEGRMFVTYNGDFQAAIPDLSVYNMMNAAEKLEFERVAGRYNYNATNENEDPSIPMLGQQRDGSSQRRYYERLALVQSGVNTYWLSEPVRLAITNGHSVNVSGGDKALLVTAGVNYRNNQGVMKGSSRNTYGGNIKLVYRGISSLSIQNNANFSGVVGEDGSWGSFSNFVNANPYYTKTAADGSIPKYLDAESSSAAINPLYNASLNSRNSSKVLNLTNNTSLDWKISNSWHLKGGLSLSSITTSNVNFIDPQHTSFDNTTYERKGTYTSGTVAFWSYRANVSVSYLKSIGAHNITMQSRAAIDESTTRSEALVAVGFPAGSVGTPSNAFSYEPSQRPSYSERINRNVSVIGAFNYNYAYRYLFDLSYNMEGSTNFGKNKKFQPFWAAGVGWNLQREPFAESWRWLDELKLRGSYGTNGNQNVNVVTSSIYSYHVGNNVFGQSAYLYRVGNPDLEWQVVEKLAAGVDVGVLSNRLKMNFDVYQSYTSPLVVVLNQRPSTGVASYPINMGFFRTRGYEFKVYYNLVNNPSRGALVSLRATGGYNRSIYGGFSDALNELNEAYRREENSQLSLSSLQRYEDGRSPSDIWAVQSLGIDPSTGREIFLTKSGEQTYLYNPNDRVVLANSRPTIEGVLGATVKYGQLSLIFNLRYRLGAYSYNSAVFNKVENISSGNIVYNQDKRALYNRWKQPGDVAEFKKIGLQEVTPVSSRFIQKDSYLRGESVKLMWNFTGSRWLSALLLQDLSVSLSMNDFFNLNTIMIERGIDYPFQRALVMNLSARF